MTTKYRRTNQLFLSLFHTGFVVTAFHNTYYRARSEEKRAAGKKITDSYIFTENPANNIYTFAVLAFMALVCNYLRTVGYYISLIKCSRAAHNSMFNALLKAPIYFFDTNPIGKFYSNKGETTTLKEI